MTEGLHIENYPFKQLKLGSSLTPNEMFQMSSSLLETSIVLLMDSSGRFMKANEGFYNTFNYVPEELAGLNINMLIDDPQQVESIKRDIENKCYWGGPLSLFNKYRHAIDSIVYISKCSLSNDYFLHILPLNHMDGYKKLLELAYTDELTGLSNFRKLQESVNSKVEQSHQSQSTFGLLFIDIDNFKQINDRYGHIVGDKLLKKCALRLLSEVKGQNRVFRKSGDEFIIIVDEKEEIETIKNRVQSQFKKIFVIQGLRIVVNISIGVSIYPDHGRYVDSLLNFADQAMYRTKRMNKALRKAK